MFKVGDEVICVEHIQSDGYRNVQELVKNKVYEITHLIMYPDGFCVVRVDNGETWWGANRFKLKEKDMFNLEDIKVGYLVELKCREHYVAMEDSKGVIKLVSQNGFLHLEQTTIEGLELTKVYGLPEHYGVGMFETKNRKLLWSEHTEMTITEIEEKLGITNLKIVGDN